MPRANVVMRKVVLTPDFQPLSDRSEIVSVEISAHPGNASEVLFRGDRGDDVPWIPGEYHSFRSIDLSTIEVRGTAGDVVTVVGGTW